MTKIEYLKKLDGMMDVLGKIVKETKTPAEHVDVLRLEFEILTAVYNCTKEEE